ncbi:hypothetical protein JCM19992_08400 [Thermostilla marina]
MRLPRPHCRALSNRNGAGLPRKQPVATELFRENSLFRMPHSRSRHRLPHEGAPPEPIRLADALFLADGKWETKYLL